MGSWFSPPPYSPLSLIFPFSPSLPAFFPTSLPPPLCLSPQSFPPLTYSLELVGLLEQGVHDELGAVALDHGSRVARAQHVAQVGALHTEEIAKYCTVLYRTALYSGCDLGQERDGSHWSCLAQCSGLPIPLSKQHGGWQECETHKALLSTLL